MSHSEAVSQYTLALRQGKRCHSDCVYRGVYPYPQVLDEIFNESDAVACQNLGVIDIPSRLIVGTRTRGRQMSFAADFMPLLPESSEFAAKWIALCEAHLSEEGIREPIVCYEYLGRFYVQEGNKRVSVLKSYCAPTIPGSVKRLIPPWSEEQEVRLYYEFLDFYRLSRLYLLSFSRLGSYQRLQLMLGFEKDHVWTEWERRSFTAAFTRFRLLVEKVRGTEEKAGDALLNLLELFRYEELRQMSDSELSDALRKLWPDVELQDEAEPIQVEMESAPEEKGGLSRLLDFLLPAHVDAAFLHEYRPEKSPWILAHEEGRLYAEAQLGESVTTRAYYLSPEESADETVERIAGEGNTVLFATTPSLMAVCRRAALKHPELKILNCSVSMPFPEVRTYYSRIYEGKFISGAVAGAMSRSGRLGYVASSPIYGVPAGINAFALGARLTNPEAQIFLRWSATEVDTFSELKALGVDMISNRDIPSPTQAQDVWGLCRVEEDGGMTPLLSPYWSWGQIYVHILRNILAGGWDELSYRNSGKAVNYWWGISSGAVDIRMSEALPQSTRELAELLRRGIGTGLIAPFRRMIRDRDGRIKNTGEQDLSPEEILTMDWLCDCVEGHIPGYEELLPIARSLVSLQGIYRDALPPEEGRTVP